METTETGDTLSYEDMIAQYLIDKVKADLANEINKYHHSIEYSIYRIANTLEKQFETNETAARS